MEPDSAASISQALMADFAARTGLSPSENPPRRYLWTDAFAVCNLLGISRLTADETWRDQALRLIDQVHRVLGRHRGDDPRRGWISGLDEAEGETHPTRGGLRIGKPRPERPRDDPPDENLEWDRDGQYFHYLTKWMHALHQASRCTADPVFLRWAVELARSAHAAFVYETPTLRRRRMFWKMRVDLSAPLVNAMGQHDPLDGLVTFSQLQVAAREMNLPTAFDLTDEIADLADMCRGIDWTTEDPLGIGGVLFDAGRIAQLLAGKAFSPAGLLAELLDSALAGLDLCTRAAPWRLPALYRLPFRELGLAIGLKGVKKIDRLAQTGPAVCDQDLPAILDRFRGHLPLADKIVRFWQVEANQTFAGWRDHPDINQVMLATALSPDGFLTL